ncbi:efflux RND transporter periplasmic adaptor subunit [Paenibacillus sp. NEAU-GSW1]|uniref:efflux RND transporter periplasmic adaptor subunit n=1 Tax=Paenibacillus sp. NEAU-GSW1 TaxID=2682486 RepID=UPI001564D694|nr:efflux RND transporter periplasmic adaptor subunit [Paenibacillus sp. NEAU-GSW1]
MKKWTVWLGIIIILAAAGGGSYYYFFARTEEAATTTAAALQSRAIKGDIKVAISGTGSVEANSRATVLAGKSGTIATLAVKEGDKVKKGQVIATFEEKDDYEDQISDINDNKEKLKEQITDKQEEYKAAIGTENEEETMAKIVDEIEELESSIEDFNEDLQDIYEEQAKEVKQVVASIDGEVTASDLSVGDEVDAKTVVIEIVDYTMLEFVTSIDELDIPNVKEGQNAQITLSSITDRTIDATVSEIAKEGTVSNGSAAYSVSLLLNDIEGVMVGMSGQADITTDSRTDVVLVPVDAVVEMGGKSFVRVPGAAAGGTGETAAGQQGGVRPQSGGTQESGAAGAGQAQGSGGTQGQRGTGAAAEGVPGGQGRMQARMQEAMKNIALGGQLQEVAVGISDETYVEIVSGLEEGATVLLPAPTGAAGMGDEAEQQRQNVFPGGGMGFPGGGGGMIFQGQGQGGGGNMRTSGGSMGGGGMR